MVCCEMPEADFLVCIVLRHCISQVAKWVSGDVCQHFVVMYINVLKGCIIFIIDKYVNYFHNSSDLQGQKKLWKTFKLH